MNSNKTRKATRGMGDKAFVALVRSPLSLLLNRWHHDVINTHYHHPETPGKKRPIISYTPVQHGCSLYPPLQSHPTFRYKRLGNRVGVRFSEVKGVRAYRARPRGAKVKVRVGAGKQKTFSGRGFSYTSHAAPVSYRVSYARLAFYRPFAHPVPKRVRPSYGSSLMTARLFPSTGRSSSPWITTVNLSDVGSCLVFKRSDQQAPPVERKRKAKR